MTFMVDADNSLADAWADLAASLEQSGAQEYQIDAMRMTFFMGAAQVHMTVDANSRGSRDEFVGMMESIRHDIDKALPRQKTLAKRGHA